MLQSSDSLKACQDFPQTTSPFLDGFHDQAYCINFLETMRWPQRFTCSRCRTQAPPYSLTRHRLLCRSCRSKCTVTAGTIFEKTRFFTSRPLIVVYLVVVGCMDTEIKPWFCVYFCQQFARLSVLSAPDVST